MKIISLYEFPSSLDKVTEILREIDNLQPVNYKDCLDIISRIIGKRESRARITLSNLKTLGFIEGKDEITLSWEAQIYIDLKRNIRGLLLYLVYENPNLFSTCNTIYMIDPLFSLSNTKLLDEMKEFGFEIGNKNTEKEKIYALKRLISVCIEDKEINPFEDYKKYIKFLEQLQKSYLNITNEKTGVTVEIEKLETSFIHQNKDFNKDKFMELLERLYYDPIYASYTSFTSVIKKFAYERYYTIGKYKYYYFRLTNYFFS